MSDACGASSVPNDAGGASSVPSDAGGAGNGVTFWFDGREFGAREGWTVGAALLAAGVRSWRTTRIGGAPRGLFCGIGVCFDCLVTVNGRPSLRACLQPVRSGDVVSSQIGTGWDDRQR